ncbi:probable cytochrome P450 49a1 isoform X1 [Anopheles bellator]|uniref:probable cytochrome P450 49a1 isoform X1 n=2 Tax=Anopheles bellator TaxID=139047 RepID=UPI002647F0D6|nr:probable cytochrome P450 49a1 isoform X1 [Anopheles bellator]XP_058058733.1 probable cytochrome P450 49a1 isoform X1 [Anopheles bellator]
MVGQRIANSLLKRSAFSSALNVDAAAATGTAVLEPTIQQQQLRHPAPTALSGQYPHARPYIDVPGPKGLPLIGNSWRFAPIIGQYKIEDLDKVMQDLHRQYGRIAKVNGLIGHPDLLFVFDADLIRDTFKKEEVQPHRPAMPSLRNYKSKLRKDFFGDNMGLIGVHGEKWDAFRAQVQQVMLQPSTAKKYIAPLDEISSDFMDRVQEMRDENDELPGDFLHELYKWALESIGRVALDTRLGCVSKDGNDESKRIINSINTFFWTVAEVELRMPVWRIYETSAYKNYLAALDTFRELCMRHINIAMEKMNSSTEQKSEECISLVERILQKTNNPKIAAVLALDLIMVGVDTTSVAATSTIYQLSQNPDKQEILFNEIKRSMPTPDTKFTISMLETMPYLRACIKETLRMYPVVIGNGRSLQTDAVIEGYHIPKGTHVIFPHLVVSNLEKYFAEPDRFVPERWLKRGELKEHSGCPHAGQKIHPYVSLPFGYGRRTCIGRRFAECELQILLSKLFRRYQVEYNYENLTYKVNPTYIPDKPLKFKLMERSS